MSYPSQTLVYVRHGERPAFTDSQKEIHKWKTSLRYKENKLDEPLTRRGKYESYLTGIELSKMKLRNIDYIYSSPMTRCIETSIAIIEAIKRTTGKILKIRIEYALCERESLFSLNYLSFSENTIIAHERINPNIIIHNNVIDKELLRDNLIYKYSEYVDSTYESFVKDIDINKERPIIALLNYINVIEKITSENNNAMIVCHSGNPYVYLRYYLTKQRFNPSDLLDLYDKLDGKKSLNFVSVFTKRRNKWTCKLEPTKLV